MGSEVRLVAGPGPQPAASALERERAWLEDAAHRLSRFVPDSELSALNSDPDVTVRCSPLLLAAVGAGVWAAQSTGGLVDPTLLGELEAAGYRDSRDGAPPVSLREALASAPPRRPAGPHPAARWRAVEVLHEQGAVRRPPGVRLDTGGVGKGLLADALAHRLGDHRWGMIDCGGDIRVTGEPFPVEVSHPLTGEHVHRFVLADGGIATSGLDVNLWRRPDGTYAHHLIDPSTGEPAWTGLVGATALGPTALEAETLAKAALLAGPAAARALLAERGGVAFHDDGDVELIGPLSRRVHAVAA
jgi:thiamine biosynthesis lipoprotein